MDKCEWMLLLQLRFGLGVWSLGFEMLASMISVCGFGWIMLDYDMRYVNIASWWHALLHGFYNLFVTFEHQMVKCEWMCPLQLRFGLGVWSLGFGMLASMISVLGFDWIMLSYDMIYVNIASWWHALLYGFYYLFVTFEY